MEASAATRPSHPGPRVPARLLRLASDERLVDHIRGGSEAAFEAVFDRHHRGILAFCRHLLGSAEEAEDAVQHTFMAAYRSLIGSRQPIQLRAWLYTIARNRCLSVLRARRETPVDDLDELPTENLSAEVQRRQDLRDLLHDVGGLPEEQRSALVLAEVGGVSHDEIAQVLGVQREKVKALVFQARSSLIASRAARETPCDEIRVQLAELRGGALRRNSLRRHLKICAGCRDFRAALQDQRKMLALALPVVPTLALKQGVMAGALGSAAAAAGGAATGGAAGAAAGGSLLAGGGAAMTAKVLAIAAIAGGGAVGIRAAAPGDESTSRETPAGLSGGGAERGQPAPGARRDAPGSGRRRRAAVLRRRAGNEAAPQRAALRGPPRQRAAIRARERGCGRPRPGSEPATSAPATAVDAREPSEQGTAKRPERETRLARSPRRADRPARADAARATLPRARPVKTPERRSADTGGRGRAGRRADRDRQADSHPAGQGQERRQARRVALGAAAHAGALS